MGKGRLEAFSDGVFAIIITIMVLELQTPEGSALHDLDGLISTFLSYVLSYTFIGIYWNNHHHLLHASHKVNGRILWANLHLLFWLSLTPFVTAWMGENEFAPIPVALYGFVLLMAGFAYFLLSQSLIAHHGRESTLAVAVGRDAKGILSAVSYAIAIPLAFISPWISVAIYIFVAIIWFIPDRRIEKIIGR